MKNEKIKANKTKILARVMLVVLLFSSAINLAGCGGKGLEAGFKWKNETDAWRDYYCAYRSDEREFNINDVTLTFYYGGNTNGIEFPFAIYFMNEEEDIYLIKEVKDHNPEDYLVNDEYNKILFTYKYTRIFNHSEIITIPADLFVNDSGYILFILTSESVDHGRPSIGIQNHQLAGISIKYEKNQDRIILSAE